jgi:hypothetical protein
MDAAHSDAADSGADAGSDVARTGNDELFVPAQADAGLAAATTPLAADADSSERSPETDADGEDAEVAEAAADAVAVAIQDAAIEPSEPETDPELPLPSAAETRPEPVAVEKRPRLAITSIVGLLGLLTLAYVANHPRIRRLEERLGVRSTIAAGSA